MALRLLLVLTFIQIAACSNPQPGPDKTVAGAVLGAGWGAGAGAVAGNQVSHTGEGAAVGAGFGLVQGALNGANYDLAESAALKQERALSAIKVQNISNHRQLRQVQNQLDRTSTSTASGGVFQVFFDADETSLKTGSLSNLEVIANSIKMSTKAHTIHVVGHTDDSGSIPYNERLAEARARSVSAFLMAHGIAADQIETTSFGSKRPIASNSTDVGRQLNRRVDVYISG